MKFPTMISSIALGVALVASSSTAWAQDFDVRIVLSEEPATLDPCQTSANVNGRVALGNIFEALTDRDQQTGEVVPALATAWEETGDTTWRFTLRDGVTFHDGTAMNAEAVKYSIERTLNPNITCETRAKFFAHGEYDVEVIDPLTLDITTDVRDPILPLKMASLSIHSTDTPNDVAVREAVGSGPYALTEWAPGQHIRVEHFDAHWGEMPEVQTAEFIWRAESSVRAAMIGQDEADLAPSIAVQDVNPEFAQSYPNAETTRLNLDSELAPLSDVRVRMAINHAINRDAMIGSILSPDVTLATQMIIPEIAGWSENVRSWEYDPQRASELLAEAQADGVPIDTEIDFVGRIGHFPNATEFHEVIAIMLGEVGLNVRLRWVEAAEKNRLQAKPFDPDRQPQIIVDQHDNTSGDPVFTLPARWSCDGAQSKTCDDQLETLMDTATAATGAERTQAWIAVADRIDELVPDAHLFHMVGYAAVGPDIAYEPTSITNSSIRLTDIGLN